MKGLFFVPYFPPEKCSGLNILTDLLEGFAAKGWDIDVFVPTPTRGVSDQIRHEYAQKRIEICFDGKITIHRMHLYREGKGFLSRALRYVIFSIECLWKALTVPADFIFSTSGPPTQGVVLGVARILSHKKFIYNLQDIFPDSLVTSGICKETSFLMKIGRVMENFTYRHADIIITITEDMRKNVLGKGVNPDKVQVVRNWMDVNQVKPVPRVQNKLFDELGLPRDKFYVVYAGNLGKVQGVEVIVAAAEKLQENSHIHFVIFGNGSEEENIKHQIADKQLTNMSLFPLQSMDRVPEVYSLGDVAIISCRAGTGGSAMPSKTWTIMATGTPIVASFDLGGEMENIIRTADCGVCVQAGDAQILSNTLERLYRNLLQVEQWGKNARVYAEKYVSKEKSVAQYIHYIIGGQK